MFRRVLNAALRRGVQTAVLVTADTAASATTRTFIQSFEVSLPTTVYVRASMSEVTLRYKPGNRVEVSANLRASFGWELVAEQDDAGIYIVAKRKPLVGQLSSANFDLSVPPGVSRRARSFALALAQSIFRNTETTLQPLPERPAAPAPIH